MATTKRKLEQLEPNLEESIGSRPVRNQPKLSPAPSAKDIGRRPDRNFGRLDINQVIADPSQPRKEFDKDAINRLAQSIKDKGQLSPIRVRWSGEHNKWVIVCGERRYRAVKAALLPTIDCYFDNERLTEGEILEQQMIENLLREDLSPIEQARGFEALMKLNGWNRKQVAASLHLPASSVTRAMALLDLPNDIQEKVDSGEIAARSAYEISKVKNTGEQRNLAEKASGGMTLQQTQVAIRQQTTTPDSRLNRLAFTTDNGWKIHAVLPAQRNHRTYESLRIALEDVIEDVDLRINNSVSLY